MTVLFVLIPLAIAMAGVAAAAFIRAVHDGQYDDLEAPAWRAIFADDGARTDVERTDLERADRRRADLVHSNSGDQTHHSPF